MLWGRVSDPVRRAGPQISWRCEQLPSSARLDGSETRLYMIIFNNLESNQSSISPLNRHFLPFVAFCVVKSIWFNNINLTNSTY